MRYGTVPIVRETGGLRDTVLSYNEYNQSGNGFTFLNYNAHVQAAQTDVRIHSDGWKLPTGQRDRKRCRNSGFANAALARGDHPGLTHAKEAGC